MKQNVFVIDRIEKNYAICENRNTKEVIEIQIEKLPKEIKEGSVLIYRDGKYELDLEEEKKIQERIVQKMKSIWNE